MRRTNFLGQKRRPQALWESCYCSNECGSYVYGDISGGGKIIDMAHKFLSKNFIAGVHDIL